MSGPPPYPTTHAALFYLIDEVQDMALLLSNKQGFKKNIETTIKLYSIKTHDHCLSRASCCVPVCVNLSCVSSYS